MSKDENEELTAFKALIRVVKSLVVLEDSYYHSRFGSETVLKEKLIYAKNKAGVKKILLEKYPQFFPNNKIYERETKDQAQFFYVLIYPLDYYELQDLNSGEWTCKGCGRVHENKYICNPKTYNGLGKEYVFCPDVDYSLPQDEVSKQRANNERDRCLKLYYGTEQNSDMPDNVHFVKLDSVSYIYKVTEKETGKCYVGKTKNEPFFRWWNHLKHSRSPFGQYLRDTSLDKWTFEVLEILPAIFTNKEILEVESKYILQFDSINNGFNSLISNKDARNDEIIDEEDQESEID